MTRNPEPLLQPRSTALWDTAAVQGASMDDRAECPRCDAPAMRDHCERGCDWAVCDACRLTLDLGRWLGFDRGGPVTL